MAHHRLEDQIVVERRGTSWAVRHNGSFLGYTNSLEEAVIVAQDLVEWIASNRRAAAVIVSESQAFASAPASATPPPQGNLRPVDPFPSSKGDWR